MSELSKIPQDLMTAAILHFTQGVPIDDCNCEPAHKKQLARVDHVYWIWRRNPFLETYPLFQQLIRGAYTTKSNENRVAHADQRLFDFVVEQVAPPSRKVQEMRVRTAANHLMDIGMQTDNAFAIADGAKIAMKLDRLDQPESEQADMTKVMFLPPIVTSQVTDVAPDKKPITDEQTQAIINKYNAHQDGKRLAIEERVNAMLAKREANQMASEMENESDDE